MPTEVSPPSENFAPSALLRLPAFSWGDAPGLLHFAPLALRPPRLTVLLYRVLGYSFRLKLVLELPNNPGEPECGHS